MKKNNWKIGQIGENLVKEKYLEKGYKFMAQNFEFRDGGVKRGEIDLIFEKENLLVFVEVKMRCGEKFGSIYEQISQAKAGRLKQTASFFMHKNPQFSNYFARFDVGLVFQNQRCVKIEILENTF